MKITINKLYKTTKFLAISTLAMFIFVGCSNVAFDGKGSPQAAIMDVPAAPGTPSNPVVPTAPEHAEVCGGPCDPDAYTGSVELAKAQSKILYSDYGACRAEADRLFGNSLVCSKMVSATIIGCQQTADRTKAALEIVVALPILKSGGMEVPYDYFMLGVPNCQVAADYINANMTAEIPTNGSFTERRATISAACVGTSDLVIHILNVYQIQ